MKKNNVILDEVSSSEVYKAGKLLFTIIYTLEPCQHTLVVEAVDGSRLRQKFVFGGFLDGYNEAKKKAMDIAMKEGDR